MSTGPHNHSRVHVLLENRSTVDKVELRKGQVIVQLLPIWYANSLLVNLKSDGEGQPVEGAPTVMLVDKELEIPTPPVAIVVADHQEAEEEQGGAAAAGTKRKPLADITNKQEEPAKKMSAVAAAAVVTAAAARVLREANNRLEADDTLELNDSASDVDETAPTRPNSPAEATQRRRHE